MRRYPDATLTDACWALRYVIHYRARLANLCRIF
jgi:hypothetical protein